MRALLARDQRPELEAAGSGGELLDERLVQRALDVDALHTGAHLAAVEERRPECTVDRACEVCVVEHHHRILAAELERHGHEPLAGGCRDEAADLARPGEDDLAKAVRAHECRADVAVALGDAHQRGRSAGGGEELLDERARTAESTRTA